MGIVVLTYKSPSATGIKAQQVHRNIQSQTIVIFPEDQRSSLFNKSVVLPTGDEEETSRHRERIFGYDEATKECDCSDERAIIDETERSVLLYL
ncbi:hypothetical protein H9L39_08593 [Fusarium oxysporum f. sp. albedinis]|nr:hypothetical protein FOMA001_g8515 [Fusarium oxysporum f. sp. matthiolae]KAK2479219.1 hypothetical protein H9L39_08593 [Fusarium oxysporum f. sp. albedinis]